VQYFLVGHWANQKLAAGFPGIVGIWVDLQVYYGPTELSEQIVQVR
jgi:hypothetical protein